MCKIWIYLAKRFNPHANIKIFYKDKIDGIIQFGSRFSNIQFIQINCDDIVPYTKMNGCVVPSQDLTLATWKWVEDNKLTRFICVEADAWILSPLDDFWSVIDSKPYIGVSERIIKDKPMLNSGVYSYSGTDFVSYTKLIEQYNLDGTIHYPFGDQWLTNAIFRRIDYDYTHPKIGFEYNCFALNCKVQKADDTDIIVNFGGGRPRRFKTLNSGESKRIHRTMRMWMGYGRRKMRRAKILHSFYIKFWELPECNQLWDYCSTKVKEIENV